MARREAIRSGVPEAFRAHQRLRDALRMTAGVEGGATGVGPRPRVFRSGTGKPGIRIAGVFAVPRDRWTDMRVSGDALRALAERG